MRTHGADEETAERVYAMIVGFSGFGFPKAHGAAFGLLAYQSTWLRVHYGPEFLCALLNEQPMGFYAPDTLAHEAQRKGIELIAPDVNLSGGGVHGRRRGPHPARAQLRARRPQRRGRGAGRRARGGRSVPLAGRPRLARGRGPRGPRPARLGGRLRRAGGRARRPRGGPPCGGSASPRPARAVGRGHAARAAARAARRAARCEPLADWDAMVADYATTGLTLGPHPVALLRPDLPAARSPRATSRRCATRRRSRIGGLVVARQRPGTAKGIVFLLLEDEFGTINLIVPPRRLRAPPPDRALRAAAARRGRLEGSRSPAGRSTSTCGTSQPLAAPGEDARRRSSCCPTAPRRSSPAPRPPAAPRRRRAGRLPRRRSRRPELRRRAAPMIAPGSRGFAPGGAGDRAGSRANG